MSADEFYVKVIRVDREQQQTEVELATPPKQTKVLFTGDVGEKVFVGDYLKFQVRQDWKINGRPVKVQSITWMF